MSKATDAATLSVERRIAEASGGFAVFTGPGKRAELLLYGPIGDSVDGVTAKQFRKALDDAGDATELTVRINSEGGLTGDGLGIYNSLKRFPGRKVVEIDGIALSAASFIAMAGDEVRMAENALMMIHNPWNVAAGDATEFRRQAMQLDKWRDGLLGIYADRTKLDRETLAAMLDAETWMDGAEAKKLGFADTVTRSVSVAAKFDPSKFRHVPPKAFALLNPGAVKAAPSLVSLERRAALERHVIRFGKGVAGAG